MVQNARRLTGSGTTGGSSACRPGDLRERSLRPGAGMSAPGSAAVLWSLARARDGLVLSRGLRVGQGAELGEDVAGLGGAGPVKYLVGLPQQHLGFRGAAGGQGASAQAS